MKKARISNFRNAAAPLALTLALISSPSFAQSTTDDPAKANTTSSATEEENSEDVIVVTGTLFSTTASATPSPVTVVTSENLEQRGISTIQDAIQQLASNNGPALTNSFTANGAFAGGASGVSLRGLSTNSTLVLFDGLRASYYPLADDGSRNFVDLNTIPDDIVERIEVLRDGASSTYGADAIAGVVNIITKREHKGIGGRAEFGISERGDAATKRFSLTAGTGDLDENGFNAYVSGFYYKSDMLYNKDRPFPFNTDDLRTLCYNDPNDSPDAGLQCGANGVLGGLNGTTIASPQTATNLMVRAFDGATNTVGSGAYINLGSIANGCPGGGTTYTLTAAQQTANPNSPGTICQYDYTNLYGVIQPNIERYGISSRVTANLGDTTEAYVEANFLQSKVDYTGFPATIRGLAPTGIFFPQFGTDRAPSATTAAGTGILTLPVYVCAAGVASVNGLGTGCNAGNGVLNPNNPFAASGQVARIIGRIQGLNNVTQNATRSRTYRVAAGVTGNITDSINYAVNATAMHTDLRRIQNGYFHINNLLTAIARGTFNFVNPDLNTQAQWDFVRPENVTDTSSDQVQLQASVAADLMELPGGPLQLGGGASVRYEAVDAPSANSDVFGPSQRYFTLNAFGTKGNRTITSAFAELDAPITSFLSLNASGRYDRYSSGQDAFSPKVGIKLTPVRQLVVRGTYSKGFRIPSFGEANALPTTGYVNPSVSFLNNTYLNQYTVPGNTAGPGGTFVTCNTTTFNGAACDPYVRGSYGQTTLASPNLQPEKSRSFTAGFVFEPTRGVSLTLDYYNIKKTGAITTPSNAPALIAYYSGQPIPAGYNVIPDAPSLNSPGATRPRAAFVQASLINANTIRSEGIDGSISLDFDVSDGLRIKTSAEASYIIDLSTTFPDGTTESYEGTSGNYNLTAGSGTPKWHGSWLTTFDFGNFELNGTVNYFGGYNLSAEDQAGVSGDCGLAAPYAPCDISAYITGDISARVRINDQFTLSFTVLNVLDEMPPVETATYGAHLYNPVQAGNGILGRYFKVGARVGF